MEGRRRLGSATGQASPEWVALLFLVAFLVLTLLVALRGHLPGASLVRLIADRILCAARLEGHCNTDDALVAAYGERMAHLIRSHAPSIAYESGMAALPVDFRSCRDTECSVGTTEGIVTTSIDGEPVTAFVHVIERGGATYLQYWLYYPDSATLRHIPVAGRRGYHRDDWESYQVRIADESVDARASSHHGYNHRGGNLSWGSDAGIGPVRGAVERTGLRRRGGWGKATGWLYVSGGSHAGRAKSFPVFRRLTPSAAVRLVPLEPIAAGKGRESFAVSPPWLKQVWSEPEAAGTS